jgi:hypothetical protein
MEALVRGARQCYFVAVRAVLLVSVFCAACGASARAPIAWPVPAGWKSEAFAFPLDFAPSIAHRGREELRFPPGFMDAKSPAFWSYAFVWQLDDDRPLDAASLSADLVAYFDGLAAAVDHDSHELPADRTPAVALLTPSLQGDITIWDAFTTGAQVTLHARITVRACGAHRTVAFEMSPADDNAAIWRDLDALAAAVPCQ